MKHIFFWFIRFGYEIILFIIIQLYTYYYVNVKKVINLDIDCWFLFTEIHDIYKDFTINIIIPILLCKDTNVKYLWNLVSDYQFIIF